MDFPLLRINALWKPTELRLHNGPLVHALSQFNPFVTENFYQIIL